MLTLCRSSFTSLCRPWRLSGAAPASIFIIHHLILILRLQKSSLACRTAAQPGTSGRAMISRLKPQRPDVGTADSQVSHFMSGEHFDILVGRLQSHFLISVEVSVFLSALTDMQKGVCLLGSNSILSRLETIKLYSLAVFICFPRSSTEVSWREVLHYSNCAEFSHKKYLGVIFQFRGARTGLLDLLTARPKICVRSSYCSVYREVTEQPLVRYILTCVLRCCIVN